jgi:hypothetical protein
MNNKHHIMDLINGLEGDVRPGRLRPVKEWIDAAEDEILSLRKQNDLYREQIKRLQRYGMAMDAAIIRLDTLSADIRSDAVKKLAGGDLAPMCDLCDRGEE